MGSIERLLDIRSVCLLSADNCVGWWGLEVLEVCMLIDLAGNYCLTEAVTRPMVQLCQAPSSK